MSLNNQSKRQFWFPFVVGVLFAGLLMLCYLGVNYFLNKSTNYERTRTHSSAASSETKTILNISITQQGVFFVNGNKVIDNKPESLFSAIIKTLEKIEETLPSVVISADGNTRYQGVVTAMDVLNRLGLNNLSLETTADDKKRQKVGGVSFK